MPESQSASGADEVGRDQLDHQALSSLEQAVLPSESVEVVMDRIVETTTRMLPASGGASVILWDAQAKEFFVRATTIPGQMSHTRIERIQREGVATRWIVENREPLIVPDVREGAFGATQMLDDLGYRAYVGVPLIVDRDVLGVLYAVDVDPREYSKADIALLKTLSGLAALALSKALLADELGKANLNLANQTRALAAANEQLEEFALVVSHDLKAPLRGVRYLLKRLQENYGAHLSGEAAELVSVMDDRLTRMNTLIEGILEYSRTAAAERQEAWFDLTGVVIRALNLVAPPDRIVVKIQSALPMLQGDATQFGQVYQNLFSNAVKSISQGPGRLEIGARQSRDDWHFFVRDTGSGIRPEDQERIFKRFLSLGSGVGIGLAVVRKIIEAHGGAVWVESRPDSGSEFVFSLPEERVKATSG